MRAADERAQQNVPVGRAARATWNRLTAGVTVVSTETAIVGRAFVRNWAPEDPWSKAQRFTVDTPSPSAVRNSFSHG